MVPFTRILRQEHEESAPFQSAHPLEQPPPRPIEHFESIGQEALEPRLPRERRRPRGRPAARLSILGPGGDVHSQIDVLERLHALDLLRPVDEKELEVVTIEGASALPHPHIVDELHPVLLSSHEGTLALDPNGLIALLLKDHRDSLAKFEISPLREVAKVSRISHEPLFEVAHRVRAPDEIGVASENRGCRSRASRRSRRAR